MVSNSIELHDNAAPRRSKELVQTLLADENYEEIANILQAIRSEFATNRTALMKMLVAVGEICNVCTKPDKIVWHPEEMVREPQHADAFTIILEANDLPQPVADHPRRAPRHDLPPSEKPHLTTQLIPKLSISTLMTMTALDELAEEAADDTTTQPRLAVYSMGAFEVYLNDQPVGGWSNRKAKLIFQYLLMHRGKPVPKEVLMDTFWPDADTDSARNNLNVTIYALRRTLHECHPDFSHILFEDDAYFLNPDMHIWMDHEEFSDQVRHSEQLENAGQIAQAIDAYQSASTLYRGNLLDEIAYEDWIVLQRQTLQNTHLQILARLCNHYFAQADYDACIKVCQQVIALDSCHEDAHRQLMRCYDLQGHRHLALRQYHLCKDALARELAADPSDETTALFEQIRDGAAQPR